MRKLAILVSLVSMSFIAKAQGGFDAASDDCKNNYSIYYELYKAKSYLDAFESWKFAFENCPEMTKNTFIYGPTIVKAKIDATKDVDKKESYIQMLYKVYDDRNKYYPEKEGYVIGLKAMDMLRYSPNDNAESFKTFEQALQFESTDHSAAFFNNYFIAVIRMFNDKSIEFGLDKVFEGYNLVSEALERNNNIFNKTIGELDAKAETTELSASELKEKEKLERELERYNSVDANLEIQIGKIANCERLASLYTDETFEINKTNIIWLRRAVKLLQKERENEEGEMESCITMPIYYKIADALYNLEPSATAARSMGKLALYNKDYVKAVEYFNSAASQEPDPIKRSDDYRRAALGYRLKGNLEAAKSSALKAISNNKNSGEGYILLAEIYGSADGVCGNNVFEKKAVFWAAIDKLKYAKSIDSSVSNKANKLIAAYSKQLPDKSISFQLNWKDGDKYTIGCWINESIVVNFNP